MSSQKEELPFKKSYSYMALGAILILTLALRLSFIHVPLDRDEGTYAVIGQEILNGAIPYRDAIEIKPPGIFYIFATIMAFGDTVEHIRICTAIYTLLTVIAAYLLARSLGGVRAGLIAALLCGIFTSGPIVEGIGSNTEVFMLLPILTGALFFFAGIDSGRRFHFIMSGFCFALAVFVKTVAAPVYLLAFLFIPFARRPFRGWLITMADMVSFAASAILLVAALYVYLKLNGAWSDCIHWTITFNKSFGRTTLEEFSGRLTSRGVNTAKEFLLLWVVALPTIYWQLRKRMTVKTWFMAGLVFATFIGVCMPGKFWPHYLLPMVPPLAVISGVGVAQLMYCRGIVLVAGMSAVVALFIPTILTDYPYFVASPEEVSRMKYSGNDVFVRAAQVARYVKERTRTDDYIFQWGYEPEIYVIAGRRPPNRFICHMYVAASPDKVVAIRDLTISILSRRPRYIIVQVGREKWPGYLELSDIITTYYHLETTIDGYTIYRTNVV